MENRIPQTPPLIPAVEVDALRPLWSIMIPSYNCTEYIKEALESVLSQDLGSEMMQIEVIDDCSTDGDVEALVREVGKGRVSFFRQPYNKGSLRNFETCIRRALGYYIHILHGDDFVANGFYKEIFDLFNCHPSAGAAFTNFRFVDHTGGPLDIKNEPLLVNKGIIPDFLTKIASRQLVQPPAMVVKRSTYEKLGTFYAVNFGEDWEMWARIASNYPIAYSPDYLAFYRVAHGIGISHSSFLRGQNIADIKKVIEIIQKYLPTGERKRLKKIAFAYYSIYCIKVANGMLSHNRKAALAQVKGALKMSNSLQTAYWAIRFYIMFFFRVKQLQKMLQALYKIKVIVVQV